MKCGDEGARQRKHLCKGTEVRENMGIQALKEAHDWYYFWLSPSQPRRGLPSLTSLWLDGFV